jgi:hypothetical protein
LSASSATREQFSGDDKELLKQVADFKPLSELGQCSQEKLREIAAVRGLDFATALLYDRVLRHSGHRSFFERVQLTQPVSSAPRPLIAIIPGAFHREHKNTGADGERLAGILESMGCAVERVPVESFGSLDRNASIITRWLKQKKNKPLIVVSLSKGSADMKIALAAPDAAEAFDQVQAWISLSGLPQGTPLVAWLQRQRWRKLGVKLVLRLRGQKYSVVEELRHGPDAPLANWPRLPRHLRIVHVIAFPLRRHLAHEWAERGFERVSPLGPNDGGGFLLADSVNLPGILFPVWGVDHYFQPAWDATPLLRRVFAAVIDSCDCRLETI